MNAIVQTLSSLLKNWKLVLAVFGLGGTISVLGLVPGTENVSNILGEKITGIKATLGTTASPTLVQ